MTLSGALAGLGGTNFVLGYKHYFELGFSGGAGFIGIAVALLGRNHPLGVVVAALFFGALSYGGLVVNQRVPRELVEVLAGAGHPVRHLGAPAAGARSRGGSA